MTKRRSKRYHPKPVHADAMNWAIAGACLLPTHIQKDLMSHVDAALDKLRRGIADKDDWNTLANAMNISEALADLQIGPNLMPTITAGQDALCDIGIRMMDSGKSTCRAPELAAIVEALEMYRIQLSLCTQAEMSRAVKRVQDMITSGGIRKVSETYAALCAREAA